MAMPKDFEGGVEVQSNWMKFEKIGDSVKGTMLEHKTVPSTNPTFPDQEVYVIRKADGNLVNVGISLKKSGTIARLNSVQPGMIVGILFESETAPTTKGFAAAKNLKVVTFGMDPAFKQEQDAFDRI